MGDRHVRTFPTTPLLQEGIQAKLTMMPEYARYKFQETLQKIVNEGSGGMIAIIL